MTRALVSGAVCVVLAGCVSIPPGQRPPSFGLPTRYARIPLAELRAEDVESIEFRDREFLEDVIRDRPGIEKLVDVLRQAELREKDSRVSFRVVWIVLRSREVVNVSLLEGDLLWGGARYEVPREVYDEILQRFGE